jgi:DNA replication protein DnaC
LKGHSVGYYRLRRLVLALKQDLAEVNYGKFLNTLAGFNFLILYYWSNEPLSAVTRNDLMEIMDNRNRQSSSV